MASTMSAAEHEQKNRELQELIYRWSPEERLVTAIHRMAIRYSDSMEERRYKRAAWQSAAIVRLSRALYRFGR